jgi:putative spermidine/putrescine transport system ATP-binding protein
MMLAGFESPTAGKILLKGDDITTMPPHRRNFGMVFQNYALFPHLTIGENVAYPLKVRKMSASEQERRVKRALEMVKLHGMTERFPSKLSGGQQQRVALARALVFEPQLVLMDEPLGALDKQLREHMQLELKELHQHLGLTFVYVTHDQSEALTMSDRVAVFNEGVIQQLDTASKIYKSPKNRFVAGFVGDSAVLEGRMHSSGSAIVLPNGNLITGENVNGVSDDAPIELCIRPERVVLRGAGRQGGGNTLSAKVDRVIYYGDHIRLLCTIVGANGDVTVKLPLSGSAEDSIPDPGAFVNLEFPAQHTRLYGA